jgi:hypothetical protein
MGTTRHLAQHALCIVQVFRLPENFAVHIHSGIRCDHDDIEICVSLCDDMGFALRKTLHVRKWGFEFEWCFINVSWLNVKRYFTFAKRFV